MRILPLTCALVLGLSGILGACSSGGDAQPTSSAPAEPNSGAESQSAASDTAAADDIVEIQILAPLFSDPPDMNNEFWVKYQELTRSKLNVEWVDSGSFHDMFHLRIASADLPEVAGVPDKRTPVLMQAIANGGFWDLTDSLGDFSEYPNLRDNVAKNCYKYLSVDGRIYATPRSRTMIDLGVNIRKDWLDKLGIPVPTNMTEYADALEQMVKGDPDGNGQNDTIGMVHAGADGSLPGSLDAAFGALTPQYNDEGGQYPPKLNDGYIDYVAYMRDLYARGILDPEYAAVKHEDAFSKFSTNRAATYSMSIWHHWEWEQGCAQVQSDPVPEVTSLVLDGNNGEKSVRLNTGVSGGYYISSKVPEEKMIRILRYFDDATTQEVTDLAYYGIEGVHHDLVDGTPVLNKKGIEQINVSSKCVGPLAYAKYGKVDSAGGSKEYNEAKREMVKDYEAIGKMDLWGTGILISETWANNWPKYEDEYKANQSKTISGQMSVEDFRAYVEGLRANPELSPAFAEFTQSYKDMFGEA